MAKIHLSKEQIKILLGLNEGPFTKSIITKRYWKKTADQRSDMMQQLIDDNFVKSELRPTLNSKVTPTYYFITKAGRQWVNQYLKEMRLA